MQNQPNETPKIIGLFVAIILVVAFAFWQYTRLRPSTTPVANVNSGTSGSGMNPSGTGTTNVTLASASGNGQAGAGQMRFFDDTLDAEPGSVSDMQIQPGRANAFRQFKPPTRPMTPVASSYSPPPWQPNLPGSGGVKAPPFDGAAVTLREMPANQAPADMTLDGVVLGSPSEAVMTVVDNSVTDGSGKSKTLYLKVGDKINKRLKIVSISEAGIMINGWSEIWLVGQTRTLGKPKTTDAAVATDNSKSSLLPSGLFAVPPPSTMAQ